MEIKTTCPLGSECEKGNADGSISRCAWYCKVVGKNPQSDQLVDDWRCAMQWMPLIMLENAQTNRGQTEAIEVFRNETVKRQDVFNQLAAQASQERLTDG